MPHRTRQRAISNACEGFLDRSIGRIGEIRVFYDISVGTVEVLAIVAKSEVDKRLGLLGNPK
jgi:hypothetical protein